MAGSIAPEKRKRQVHPKTRTGCKTCKIRKVKCDEDKPFCKRCISTGRKCDGYPSTQPIQVHFLAPASSSTTRAPPLSALDRSLALVLTQQINASIPGTLAEKRGFQYFVANTAGELSGYFTDEFWKGYVLRGCWSDGALRHAVVSIGALHESFGRGDVGEEASKAFAVIQYSKAISHLRQTLNSTNPDRSLLIALISCIIFIIFDSQRGNLNSALLHLQNGLQILKEVRSQIKRKSRRNGRVISKDEEFIIQKYITPIFVRLSCQAILYADTRSMNILAKQLAVDDNDIQHETNITEKEWVFEDLDEAREKLNVAAAGMFRMFYVCDGALPFSQQPPLARSLHATHSYALQRWGKAFDTYMSKHSASLNAKQIRAAALLKIHHINFDIMRSTTASMTDTRSIAEATNSPSTFRGAANSFATIVALSKSFILTIEQDVLKADDTRPRKTFSSDVGVVGPLYFAGIKCTVKEVRDEALRLLERWKKGKGMWDSSAGGKLMGDFWTMESKFGNQRGNGHDRGAAEPGFVDPPRLDRVRLVLVEGERWVWKYTTNVDMDDGRFEGADDAGVGTEVDFNADPLEWSWDALVQEDLEFSTIGATESEVGEGAAGSVEGGDDWMEMMYQQQQTENSYPDPEIVLGDFEPALEGLMPPGGLGQHESIL